MLTFLLLFSYLYCIAFSTINILNDIRRRIGLYKPTCVGPIVSFFFLFFVPGVPNSSLAFRGFEYLLYIRYYVKYMSLYVLKGNK